jgi:hypothetical protein
MTSVFCGIDWATDHHDIALLDETGTLLAKLRIDDSPQGLAQLLDLLAHHGDHPNNPRTLDSFPWRPQLLKLWKQGRRPVPAAS